MKWAEVAQDLYSPAGSPYNRPFLHFYLPFKTCLSVHYDKPNRKALSHVTAVTHAATDLGRAQVRLESGVEE